MITNQTYRGPWLGHHYAKPFYRGSVRPNGIGASKYTTTDKLKVMDRAHYPCQALMNNDTLRNVMCLKPSVKVT